MYTLLVFLDGVAREGLTIGRAVARIGNATVQFALRFLPR